MKRLKTKTIQTLLGAVLLTLFAAGCSKQDTSPTVVSGTDGADDFVALAVSLPQSAVKTILGSPDQGKYPTLWQTADRISLNGSPSLPLSEVAAGGSSASFVFRGGLSSPFNILYPATTSPDTVVFPAVQAYSAGTFDPEATPMWASTAEYQDVELKHLGSLLRFDIKGAVTLRSITVSAGGGEPLCGSFRMVKDDSGLFTGAIEAMEDCSENLTLSFGEDGLALNENEATPIYLAIPAGSYSKGFKAVINAVGGKVMVISFFTAEGREIAPSKLLHFDSFTFSDGGSDNCYIYTVEDLAALSSSSAKKAYLMTDLDISATTWTSIENWSGTLDGMGHSITGTATMSPLFKLSNAATTFSLDALCIIGMPSFDIAAGNLSAKNCEFRDFQTTTTTPVVRLAAGGGNVIKFDHCRFLNNRNSYSGGVVIQMMNTWAGDLMLNACTICGNINSKYGCVHSAAPSSDLGGFAGIFNCLFYDNRGASSTASKSTECADINLSIRHVVANSTFVSTAEHLCLMNVRCGSMTAYSGGAKGGLYVNNIFVNEYSSGYCFNMAAANKYQITLGGYNRYNKGENTTYGGVTYSTADKKTETEGSYDDATAKWTWTPSEDDKTAMFAGSGTDMDNYLKSTSDAEYLRPYVTGFCSWLEELGAFGTDLYGNARSGAIYWPGCYQGQ